MRWLTKRKCNFNSGYEYLAVAKKVKKKIQFLAKRPILVCCVGGFQTSNQKYSAVLSLARISKQVNLPCRNTVKQKYNNGIRRQNPPKYRQQLRKVALRHLIHLHWKIFSTGMKVVLPFLC